MSTIGETLAPFRTDEANGAGLDWDAVTAALQAREDQMREDLHVIAMRLGTYPEFVAMAFAEVGLGTPPTEEGMTLLRQQFAQRQAWLQHMIAEHMGISEAEQAAMPDPTEAPDIPPEDDTK